MSIWYLVAAVIGYIFCEYIHLRERTAAKAARIDTSQRIKGQCRAYRRGIEQGRLPQATHIEPLVFDLRK